MTEAPATVFSFDVDKEASLAVLITLAGRYLRSHPVPEVEVARVLTATLELARNATRYGGGGQVKLQIRHEDEGRMWVDLQVSDEGPGIADIEQAMQEAFSTAQSLGLGLPGVRRLMHDFQLESQPGRGTRVRASRCVIWRAP